MRQLNLVVLFLCLFMSVQSATYYSGIIFKKDGTQKEGLIGRIKPKDSKVKYKKNKNSSVEKIPSKEIERVIFLGDKEEDADTYSEAIYTAYYSFYFNKLKKPMWFSTVIKGPVSLYSYYITKNNVVTTIYYICKRENENYPTNVLIDTKSSFAIADPFYKQAAKYFADYPELAEKILAKEYRKNIIEMVNEYNLWMISK